MLDLERHFTILTNTFSNLNKICNLDKYIVGDESLFNFLEGSVIFSYSNYLSLLKMEKDFLFSFANILVEHNVTRSDFKMYFSELFTSSDQLEYV